MGREAGDFLPGTLDLLILRTLAWGPMHGYGITQWLRERTDETLTIQDAALYQALRRLERKGWVEAEWAQTENNRQARYYTMTPAGRGHLAREASAWRAYAKAVQQVLDSTPARG